MSGYDTPKPNLHSWPKGTFGTDDEQIRVEKSPAIVHRNAYGPGKPSSTILDQQERYEAATWKVYQRQLMTYDDGSERMCFVIVEELGSEDDAIAAAPTYLE